MTLNAKNVAGGNGGGNRVAQETLEPGNYPARLVQIIDFGLQPQRPYMGKDKPPAQEIGLTYELVDAFMKDEEGNELEDKPRWISETMPLHNLQNTKARSTERYKAFDPDEVHGGDWTQVIGDPCMVTVVNNAKGDKVYENVGNVTQMRARDAAKCPELKNPVKVFDLDDPDMEVFAKLPKWIQEKIQGNLNFKGSKLEKLVGKPASKKEELKKVEQEDAPFDADDAGDNNPY